MSYNTQAYGHRSYPTMHKAAKRIIGNVVDLGACAPCAAAKNLSGPPHYHRIQYPDGQWGRTQKDYLTGLGSARLWIGLTPYAGPLGYHLWAPKKWKRLNPIMNIAAVIAIYIGTVWVMRKA